MTHKIELKTVLYKRLLPLTFVVGLAGFSFAQEKLNVSGKIVNQDNQAIPYASVSFFNKTSNALSDAGLTDDQGNYTVSVAAGDYNITIEAIDYKKLTSTKTVSASGNIGILKISKEGNVTTGKVEEIQSVVLTANKRPVQVQIDKKIYDVKSDLTSIGGNLQDVLQNVPSISVDPDGTVSMRGSSNIRFLVNGKPSALLGIDDGANALQAIPADQIDRIEVITNPSSKYDASGTAGILNIILKKNTKAGFNGSVVGSLGYLPRTSLNVNLGWRKNNWNWFLNGGGGYSENKGISRNVTNYYNTDIGDIMKSTQNSETKNNSNNYNASAGFVYDLSDKTSINTSLTVRTFDGENKGFVNYQDTYNGNGSTFSQRLSNGTNSNWGLQGDFGLDHKFDDKGQNISVALSLQKNNSNSDSFVTETANNIFNLGNIIGNSSLTKSVVGKIDYELPIGENSNFSAGYKLDYNNNGYDNSVQEKTATDPNYNFLNDFTSTTNYTEKINAFYAQYKSKIGNLGYQLGLRDEWSTIDINYQNIAGAGNTNKKDYNNLFPSVFLSYDLSKNNQFLLNYTRRIDRPRSFFLIPYPSYNDNRNFFQGNPNLNPSYIDSFEFGYNLQKSKFTFNPTLYYRNETDDVKFAIIQDSNSSNVFNSSPINLGTDKRYGLELNASFDAFPWLKFLADLDLFGYKTDGVFNYIGPNNTPALIDYTGSGFSTRSRLTTTIKFDKTFSLQLQGFMRGAQKSESQTSKGSSSLNIGATKTIWKGDGTLSFNMQDIFNGRVREITALGSNYDRYSFNQGQPRQVSVSLTYRFKQGEKIEQPKKKKDINNNDSGDDQQMPGI